MPSAQSRRSVFHSKRKSKNKSFPLSAFRFQFFANFAVGKEFWRKG
jgi:hypothetical protein